MAPEPREANWGRLEPGSAAPEHGEKFTPIVELSGTSIEQILSGRLVTSEEHLQNHDEWVVVLEGSATLEVSDEHRTLEARDWVFIPAGMPHRVVSTQPGTSWLAVHVHASASVTGIGR